jgi:hypothetical protein
LAIVLTSRARAGDNEMRLSATIVCASAFLGVGLAFANAQPFRCELYAEAAERVPCYYARAAHAAALAAPTYVYRHRHWKRHAKHHARADASRYTR